jgi:hypothetical protein
MRHVLGDEPMRGEIIAQNYDQVRAETVGSLDNLPDTGKPQIRTAGMQIGDNDNGYSQAMAGRSAPAAPANNR